MHYFSVHAFFVLSVIVYTVFSAEQACCSEMFSNGKSKTMHACELHEDRIQIL